MSILYVKVKLWIYNATVAIVIIEATSDISICLSTFDLGPGKGDKHLNCEYLVNGDKEWKVDIAIKLQQLYDLSIRLLT